MFAHFSIPLLFSNNRNRLFFQSYFFFQSVSDQIEYTQVFTERSIDTCIPVPAPVEAKSKSTPAIVEYINVAREMFAKNKAPSTKPKIILRKEKGYSNASSLGSATNESRLVSSFLTPLSKNDWTHTPLGKSVIYQFLLLPGGLATPLFNGSFCGGEACINLFLFVFQSTPSLQSCLTNSSASSAASNLSGSTSFFSLIKNL